MSRLDYSKWDHIEISDDEDDTHPNIDTPSLFRWRHQARLERMDEAKKEKDKLHQDKESHQKKLFEMKQKLKEAEEQNAAEQLSKLKLEISEIEKQSEEFMKKEEELKKKEKLTPLNIDTICKEGKSKTVINKITRSKEENLSEEERFKRQQEFQDKNESLMKKFGMMQKYEDSKTFLEEHKQLVCEETANYLVLWCINLEVEEKSSLMDHVSHQTIVMQFILELAKSLDMDPRNCVRPFFTRISTADKQYMSAFQDELDSFRKRVRDRAKARIDAAIKEYEEEERQKRLGPGGLDPQEVFESLPEPLQKCFEAQDIPLLQKTISEMKPEEAEYHIKRCVDSGLWVPNAKDAENAKAAGEAEEEEVYEDVPEVAEK